MCGDEHLGQGTDGEKGGVTQQGHAGGTYHAGRDLGQYPRASQRIPAQMRVCSTMPGCDMIQAPCETEAATRLYDRDQLVQPPTGTWKTFGAFSVMASVQV